MNKDHEQLKVTQDFLRDGAISVDIFGLARGGEVQAAAAQGAPRRRRARLASTFARGRGVGSFGASSAVLTTPVAVIAPARQGAADASARGESVRVDVVVRTRKVGHFFPGGTVDAFDVWVELEATDATAARSSTAARSEDGGKGPVEPGAHFYRSLQLDEHGNPINKRNAWHALAWPTCASSRPAPPTPSTTGCRFPRTRADPSRCGPR